MKNIKLKIITALFSVGLIGVGCSEDFLTHEPQGQFSENDVNTANGVEGKLISAYKALNGYGLDGQSSWNNEIQNWVFGGITSDDALKGTTAGDQPEQSFIEAYNFQTFNGHITNKWRGLYKGVSRTNDVLDSVEELEEGALSEERKKEIIAEARFLRGIFHFEARKLWRKPLYIDETVYDRNDVESTKIANDKEIWPLIEADFEAAIADLPETQGEVGRPTKWAAMAFLAKAKMYQGWDDNGNPNTAKLGEAKVILDKIVDSERYSLVPTFEENFLVATRNNRESIFEVQYSISSSITQAANIGIASLAHPYTDPWSCCGFYQAPQNLVNAFKTEAGLPMLETFDNEDVSFKITADSLPVYNKPLDPRIDHTLGRPGILFKGFKLHQTDFIRDLSYAGPYSSKKHLAEPEHFGVSGTPRYSANNYRIMRLGMVLLWLAECEVEIGDLNRAEELVNMIRERAANPDGFVPKALQGKERNDFTIVKGQPAANYDIQPYPVGTFLSKGKDFARDAVRFESRLEFAMEGHRFFDLQRWGVSAKVLNAYLESESEHREYLKGKTFTPNKNEYFPIPIQAIDRSYKNGQPTLTQDPAY